MPPYSYCHDPNVPAFDDAAPVAFVDRACLLCTFGERAISALDKTGDIGI